MPWTRLDQVPLHLLASRSPWSRASTSAIGVSEMVQSRKAVFPLPLLAMLPLQDISSLSKTMSGTAHHSP